MIRKAKTFFEIWIFEFFDLYKCKVVLSQDKNFFFKNSLWNTQDDGVSKFSLLFDKNISQLIGWRNCVEIANGSCLYTSTMTVARNWLEVTDWKELIETNWLQEAGCKELFAGSWQEVDCKKLDFSIVRILEFVISTLYGMRIEPERTWEPFQDLVIVVIVPVVSAAPNCG